MDRLAKAKDSEKMKDRRGFITKTYGVLAGQAAAVTIMMIFPWIFSNQRKSF